jgi:hypothetical protein
MRAELAALQAALPSAGWLRIAARPAGAIKLTPLAAAPEPRNLRRLKGEVLARWGTVPLIDMLKEAVLGTGCLAAVTSAPGAARSRKRTGPAAVAGLARPDVAAPATLADRRLPVLAPAVAGSPSCPGRTQRLAVGHYRGDRRHRHW